MTTPPAVPGAAGPYPQLAAGPYPQTLYGHVNGHMWNGRQWVPAPPSSQNAPLPPQQPSVSRGPDPSADTPPTTLPKPKETHLQAMVGMGRRRSCPTNRHRRNCRRWRGQSSSRAGCA